MKKLLIIQIDGLSYPTLQTAIKNHSMPYVSGLVDRGWKIHEVFSGLPSTTPASQMRLFYGINDLVVCFRMFLRKEKKQFTVFQPKTVTIVEKMAAARNSHPLLEGGTGIFTIFSGGSTSSVSYSALMQDMGVVWRIFRFFLHPIRLFWYIAKTIFFMIIEIREYRKNPKESFLRHLIRLVSLLFESLTVFEVGSYKLRDSIKADVSPIYINYSAYDGLSHEYGPRSDFAYAFLSLIDMFLAHMVEFAQLHSYSVTIVSDHGHDYSYMESNSEKGTVLDKIIADHPSIRFGHGDTLTVDEHHNYDLIGCLSCGLLAFFDASSNTPLSYDAIEKKYPGFITYLSRLPSVGFVLMPNLKQPKIITSSGTYPLSQQAIEGELRFCGEEDKKRVLHQLVLLSQAETAADIYIFGAVINEHEAYNFEPSLGQHGSIGGDQTRAFFLSRDIDIQEHEMGDLSDLYGVLKHYISTN
jgi:hypothetical protein